MRRHGRAHLVVEANPSRRCRWIAPLPIAQPRSREEGGVKGTGSLFYRERSGRFDTGSGGVHHRRFGRRLKQDCDLVSDRCAIRLRPVVDGGRAASAALLHAGGYGADRSGAREGAGLGHSRSVRIVAGRNFATLVVMADTINAAVDIGAVAASAQLVLPISIKALIVIVTSLVFVLGVFAGYGRYANVLKGLGLVLLTYLFTVMAVAKPLGRGSQAHIRPPYRAHHVVTVPDRWYLRDHDYDRRDTKIGTAWAEIVHWAAIVVCSTCRFAMESPTSPRPVRHRGH